MVLVSEKDWQQAQITAQKMADAGQPAEGLAQLIASADMKPGDRQLASIFQIASTYGQYEAVLPLAESYAAERKTRVLKHRFCNAWVIDVLRKTQRYNTVMDLICSFEPDQMASQVFYHNLSILMHDESFLRAAQADPRLEVLFVLSVEQKHIDERAFPSKFILRNSTQFVAAPQAYTTFLLSHRALMEKVESRLNETKNTLLVKLLLDMVGAVPQNTLISALARAHTREINAVWSIHHAHLHRLMSLFYVDGSFDAAVDALSPEVILCFEKLGASNPDTGLTLITNSWVDRIPKRYAGSIDCMPTEVLDQLAIKHRERAPQVYEWYTSNRADRDQLTELEVLRPARKFCAPRLSLDRKPRVGVCISGQLRGYRQAYPSVKKLLLAGTEPVIFVDTWKKIGRKTPTPAQAWRMFGGEFLNVYQSVANNIGYPAMQARYPALTTLDDDSSVSVDRLVEFFGCNLEDVRIEDDEAGIFTNFSNPQKMYHKIDGCQNMLESSGIEVDAVLRIRPDKSVNGVTRLFDWHRIITSSSFQKVFYADFPYRMHSSSGLVIGDQAGISSMELMHIYAQAIHSTVAAGKLNWTDWPSAPRAHANLSHALWINDVQVETMPVQWGTNLDPEKLTAATTLALIEQDVASRPPDANDERLLFAARTDLSSGF